ncbi:MAG: RNA ligase family protein [Kiritimatiellae bacterium]|nr:RNA ligase family protein [Kiritimatiellia bacterium]
MLKILKYPRTPHIQGSRIQPGDEDLDQIPFRTIAGRRLVVEEKCDGANSAVSFDTDGTLLLQSRGHYLTGGPRERHYDLLKKWASVHKARFHEILGSRYILYGEWMYAKHSIYYDALPHYFLEFDVFDRERGVFLDTPTRRTLLAPLPVVPAPVIARRSFATLDELKSLVGPSAYIRPGHIERLRAWCAANGSCGDADARCAETDPVTTMEGLYLKVEEAGQVVARMKFVRPSFLQAIAVPDAHWLNRPIVPNALRYPVEGLYEATLPKEALT